MLLTNEKKLLIEYMSRVGLTDNEIASKLGIDLVELIVAKQDDPDFASRMNDIRASRVRDVEEALYKRSIGYMTTEVHQIKHSDGRMTDKTIVKEVTPDINAIKYFLNNMESERWRDRGVGDRENPMALSMVFDPDRRKALVDQIIGE